MTDSSSLATLSDRLVLIAIAALLAAFVAHCAAAAAAVRTRRARAIVAVLAGGPPTSIAPAELVPAPRSAARVASALTVLGCGVLTAAVATRGLAAGRVPWGNMYEFALTGALGVGCAFVVLQSLRRVADLAPAVGVWVVGLTLLLLGLAVTVLYTPVDGLVPVLDSYWLVVHVAAAIFAGSLFAVGFVLVVVVAWRRRRGDDADDLAEVAHAVHVFAFPVWTFAVIAGAIWAENAWGRYWGWDPKETWAFITWVLYAAYLHASSTAGWRGGRATALAVAGFLAFVFNFFGVNIWLPGLHSYAGV